MKRFTHWATIVLAILTVLSLVAILAACAVGMWIDVADRLNRAEPVGCPGAQSENPAAPFEESTMPDYDEKEKKEAQKMLREMGAIGKAVWEATEEIANGKVKSLRYTMKRRDITFEIHIKQVK